LGSDKESQRKAKSQQVASDNKRQLSVRRKGIPIRNDYAAAERFDMHLAIEFRNLEDA
jgi:hypothetical protein